MTSKGQVTIPLQLRERYGLTAGAEVEVIAGETGAIVQPMMDAGVRDGRGLVARLRDQADGGLDADTILNLTRGDQPA